MTVFKYYLGGMGPFLYDDTIPLLDPEGDFPGENQHGLITDGPVKVDNVLTLNSLQFETGLSSPTQSEGQMSWDNNDKTVQIDTEVSGTRIQLGQEMVVRATNKTGVTLTNGQIVYVNGAQGSRPTIALAKADSPTTAGALLGFVTNEDGILDNTTGYITINGLVRDVDTSGIAAGNMAYLSAITSGEFTGTAPTAPNFPISVGIVLFSNASSGIILVSVGPTDVVRAMVIQALTLNDTLVLPKTSGVGIKVDQVSPTFGFADIIGDQFSKNTGATKPTLIAYNGVINAWQFGNGDEAYMSFHIPHDYVIGTDIHLHIHWSQNAAGATGGTLDFRYTAIYAKGHNQVSGSVFTTIPKTALFSSININDGGSGLLQYQQHLTEVTISAATATAALFDRDDFEPDGVIELTFEMDADNLTGSASSPFIHFVDIHYQTTGIIGTKDKAPNFYT